MCNREVRRSMLKSVIDARSILELNITYAREQPMSTPDRTNEYPPPTPLDEAERNLPTDPEARVQIEHAHQADIEQQRSQGPDATTTQAEDTQA